MLAGFDGSFGASAILPGEDDGAVAFHSSCGGRRPYGYTRCDLVSRFSHHILNSGPSKSDYSARRKAYDETHSQMKGVARKYYKHCKAKKLGCK
jgi:hypothetical protein